MTHVRSAPPVHAGKERAQTHPWRSPLVGDLPPVSLTGIRLSAGVLFAVAAGGLAAAAFLRNQGLDRPGPSRSNIFIRLFVLHEPWFLAFDCLFAILVFFLARKGSGGSPNGPASDSKPHWLGVWSVAGVVGVFTSVGQSVFLHRLPFSMDEFAAIFQARIFASGRLEAQLPALWQRFGFALTPVFIEYKRQTHVWVETYLPVYSAMRAAFLRLGADSLTNSLLAVASLLAIAAVARRLWPDRPSSVLVAVLCLASSAQFLLMSMSYYAMSAYLCLNLLWLLLYVRRDRWSWLALPWLGVLALGVHHPFPHALFVAPFLMRMLFENRGKWLGYICGVYGLGVGGWWAWLRSVQPYTHDGKFWSLFSFPLPSETLTQLMHLAVTFSWQMPLVPILLVLSFLSVRRLPPVGRDLAYGVVATFLFYCLFPAGQGHGWGYRYIFGVLGNIALLSVYGWQAITSSLHSWKPMLWASLAWAFAIQIPVRSSQASNFVRPFARAQAHVASLHGVVVVDPDIAWYAQDLVRNDPFLQDDPKVLNGGRLPASRRHELELTFPGSVRDLTRDELLALGYPGVIEITGPRRPAMDKNPRATPSKRPSKPDQKGNL